MDFKRLKIHSRFIIVLGIVLFDLRSTGAVEDGNEKFIRRDARKSIIPCPDRDPSVTSNCPSNCTADIHCNARLGEKCLCFNDCGLSCLNKKKAYCKHPGRIPNGKVLLESRKGYLELNFMNQKVPTGGRILYKCNPGYTPAIAWMEKSCKNGAWESGGGRRQREEPRCVKTLKERREEVERLRWSGRSSGRSKRAIKTGGSSSIVRSQSNKPVGGLHGTTRRKIKGKKHEEDIDEPAPMICSNLDHDPFILIEVVVRGDEFNETFSTGAVVKVSCKLGFGVNLPNETVKCDNGRWRPKIPQCSALPCKVPFIQNGVFYNGTKPLYFQENKKHDAWADIKCLKGYKLRGPSRVHCWYGEWDVQDNIECLPAPCKLPLLEHGEYLQGYEAGKWMEHGKEVDYLCNGGGYRKIFPGPVRCELGEWKPNSPYCVHPSSGIGKKGGIQTLVKRPCGSPNKLNNAYTYVNGLPLVWDKQFSFPDGTDVLYRCSTLKAKAKNRWKITCEDGLWTGFTNLTCDGDAPKDLWMSLPEISMINGSCIFKRQDPHVITFYDDQMILEDRKEFPSGTEIVSRCKDIGKFQFQGAVKRRCLSAQWMGITPNCQGLSQYQDYELQQSPTILFRYTKGSIVQSTDGNLVVFPGTTLHMECLWMRKFGKPTWSTSITNKTFPEGWADEPGRDSQLEYRLTIENVQKSDAGRYACKTPARHTHEINLLVEEAYCQPLPEHPDLIYSTTDLIMGTRVTFQCVRNNSLVGAQEIYCTNKGKWSAVLPKCVDVECSDISLVPAMGPPDYTSITKNGSRTRNETAPPKVTVYGTHVGAKATFSCDPDYMLEGMEEITCNPNGQWSHPVPHCKEVECSEPPEIENAKLAPESESKMRYRPGDFATYECDSGYMLEGQALLPCQDNGQFSKANTIKCKIACAYPGTIIGGTLSELKFNYEAGEEIQFKCQDGYEIQGARKMHCLASGKWNSPLPTCVPRNYDHVSNPRY